ncbi:transcription factor bHLH144 [Lycium ferocissimum]|uniref:transcription factor bHLH144 n=1 Tax=Lycium ferocissimum TaxID=112874 RepID=UPI00281530AA|nr:transcription factor bHLH144 [Lycium ferocissimum]
MQSNYQFSPENPFVSLEDQAAGGNIFDIPAPSVFGTMELPTGLRSSVPFHGFEFQSSEACPKNFIIFDQTDYRSQIMYHPAMASKFPYPDLNYNATCFQHGMERKIAIANNENTEVSSSYLKEDSADINALLSLEEEEHEEYDHEEVSTARTNANYGSSSPESYSNYDCQSKKSRTSSSFRKSSGSSTSNCSERKRRKLKKMVKALKGIVPGASRMNTVTVLDEAVRYLKSLKVEVQKLGVENLKTFA